MLTGKTFFLFLVSDNFFAGFEIAFNILGLRFPISLSVGRGFGSGKSKGSLPEAAFGMVVVAVRPLFILRS